MKAVRWLSCYTRSNLDAAVRFETGVHVRHVAAEALAHGRSVILAHVASPLVGLIFEVDQFEWASTVDAYSTAGVDGQLVVDRTKVILVPVDKFTRVWAAIVRKAAATGQKLLHSEVSLGNSRRVVGVAYRAGDKKAAEMAAVVGHWLKQPVVEIKPWRDSHV